MSTFKQEVKPGPRIERHASIPSVPSGIFLKTHEKTHGGIIRAHIPEMEIVIPDIPSGIVL